MKTAHSNLLLIRRLLSFYYRLLNPDDDDYPTNVNWDAAIEISPVKKIK